MKYNKKSVGLLATVLVLMGGMFYASCSSEDDPMTFEESGNEKAEYIKNKVLMLAEEYGLDFKIENEALFMKEAAEGKINVDSMETHFKALAQIKGYYTGLMATGRKITLNTGKEKLLKKVSRVERNTDDYDGMFYRTAYHGNGSSLSYTVTYSYDVKTQTGLVELQDFHLQPSGYSSQLSYDTHNPIVSNFQYQFTGSLPSFNYSANVKFYTYDRKWSISFSLSGEYTAGGAEDTAEPDESINPAANNTTNGGFGYAVIQ